jgi:hypothetical protein
MNKRDLQNEELDRIGRKLLDATRVRSKEIEQVVGSPLLFNAVKARIEIERRERNSKSGFGWASFQIRNWQTVAASVFLLFFIGAISFIGTSKFSDQPETEQAAAPEIQPQAGQIEISQPATLITEDAPAIVKTKNYAVESPRTAKQKVFISKILKARKTSARKPNQQPRLQLKQNEPSGEFYALTLAGNPVENGEELRIVRAELSRSSLFALGVNLPIENESEKIKTDLLVGADGIARAIRLVN